MKIKTYNQLKDYLFKFKKPFAKKYEQAINELSELGDTLLQSTIPEITKMSRESLNMLFSTTRTTNNLKDLQLIYERILVTFRELKTISPLYEFQSTLSNLQNMKNIDEKTLQTVIKNMSSQLNKIDGDKHNILKDAISECKTIDDYEHIFSVIEGSLLQ